MTFFRSKSVCVDSEWAGRSDCRHCAVRHIVPFASLPVERLDEFLMPVNNFRMPAGTRILGPEIRADAIVTIRRGFVKLVELSTTGRERIVRLLGPGDVVGLEALHAPPYLHAAVSLTPIDACLIPIPVVRDLESRTPELHATLLERWHRSIEQADRFISSLLDGPATARVARLLLLLAELSRDGPPPRLSRLDTAAAVDIAPETASRILTRWIDEGTVVEERDTFRLDTAALERIAAG